MTPCFNLEFLRLKNSLASGGDTGNDCIGTAVRQGAKSAAWRQSSPRFERITREIGKSNPKAWKKHPKPHIKGDLANSSQKDISKIVHITMGWITIGGLGDFFRGHNFGIQDPSLEAAISNCKTLPPPTKKHRAPELSRRKNLADQLQDKEPLFSKESGTDHSTDHTASEDCYIGPFGCMEACTWMIWTDISN